MSRVAKPSSLLWGLGPAPAVAVLAVLMLAALGLAWTVNRYFVYVLANVALLAIVGIGLNVLLGLTGQVSFGHAGFYALGAYAVAVLTTKFGLNFWLAWLLGVALSAVLGFLLALPALRVKGPYLAMVTIAFGFIVEHGIVEPSGPTPEQWLFDASALAIVKRAFRLQADLQIEWAGVALALQLLDELEHLRAENSHLRRRLSRFEQP